MHWSPLFLAIHYRLLIPFYSNCNSRFETYFTSVGIYARSCIITRPCHAKQWNNLEIFWYFQSAAVLFLSAEHKKTRPGYVTVIFINIKQAATCWNSVKSLYQWGDWCCRIYLYKYAYLDGVRRVIFICTIANITYSDWCMGISCEFATLRHHQ